MKGKQTEKGRPSKDLKAKNQPTTTTTKKADSSSSLTSSIDNTATSNTEFKDIYLKQFYFQLGLNQMKNVIVLVL